ncbi:TlpA family protein disulfide reductase [bacterium]|nr:TlpA family protein disulfide reductase [bacterium]
MEKGFLKDQWAKYTTRKTRIGIVLDFLFIFLFIGMVIPSSRKVISSNVIRYTMSRSPETEKAKSYITKADKQWKFKTALGDIVTIESLKDKVLFINFWATWCPPCIAEMPSIQKLYNTYGDKVEFLMLTSEDFSVTQKFMDKKEYSFPVSQLLSKLPAVFATRGIPATFIISKHGEVVMGKEGPANWNSDNIQNLLNKLIEE